jgi:hypothetical protein
MSPSDSAVVPRNRIEERRTSTAFNAKDAKERRKVARRIVARSSFRFSFASFALKAVDVDVSALKPLPGPPHRPCHANAPGTRGTPRCRVGNPTAGPRAAFCHVNLGFQREGTPRNAKKKRTVEWATMILASFRVPCAFRRGPSR